MYKLIYWDRWQFFWSPKTIGIGRDWEDLSIGPTGLPKSDDLPKKFGATRKIQLSHFWIDIDEYCLVPPKKLRWFISTLAKKKIKMWKSLESLKSWLIIPARGFFCATVPAVLRRLSSFVMSLLLVNLIMCYTMRLTISNSKKSDNPTESPRAGYFSLPVFQLNEVAKPVRQESITNLTCPRHVLRVIRNDTGN